MMTSTIISKMKKNNYLKYENERIAPAYTGAIFIEVI